MTMLDLDALARLDKALARRKPASQSAQDKAA
jgi:hypothetical protein